MEKPSDQVIEAVAPARDIGGLPISDSGVRNMAGAETKDTLRLPRGGPHKPALVSVQKYYDGLAGGEAGEYALLFVEFQAASSRWRTSGVKVRAAEAARIARDLLAGKPSKPGKTEKPRIGGKASAREDSTLCGAPVPGGYVIYVKSKGNSDAWVRSRGIEVLRTEASSVAKSFKALAAKEVPRR